MRTRATYITSLLLTIVVTLPTTALAQFNIQTPDSVKNVSDIGDLIGRIFNITVGISGVLFVGLLLLGGVLYLTSLGNEEGVTKARKTMLNAGVGLIIVLSAWGVGNYILRLFGVQISLTGSALPSAQDATRGIIDATTP